MERDRAAEAPGHALVVLEAVEQEAEGFARDGPVGAVPVGVLRGVLGGSAGLACATLLWLSHLTLGITAGLAGGLPPVTPQPQVLRAGSGRGATRRRGETRRLRFVASCAPPAARVMAAYARENDMGCRCAPGRFGHAHR